MSKYSKAPKLRRVVSHTPVRSAAGIHCIVDCLGTEAGVGRGGEETTQAI
jgi:hypothetical protein